FPTAPPISSGNPEWLPPPFENRWTGTANLSAWSSSWPSTKRSESVTVLYFGRWSVSPTIRRRWTRSSMSRNTVIGTIICNETKHRKDVMWMKLLAVTSCPNGIAHTYMAAEKLAQTAAEAGIDIKVETQGSIGAENVLTEEEIEAADGIILAVDKSIEMDRFEGKRVLSCAVSDAIRKPEELIQRFESGEVPVHRSREEAGETDDITQTNPTHKEERGQNLIYRSLMNGVSYMIPFVVVGGLLIALSLGLGGEPGAKGLVVPEDSVWSSILKVGEAAFTFMVPILAGYIAVSIADRPGLAPGMIGGFIAANGSFYGSEAGAGFIGGILAGFIAGIITRWIKSLPVPSVLQPIMPILVIPLTASTLVAPLFLFVVGAPIASLREGLTQFLQGSRG